MASCELAKTFPFFLSRSQLTDIDVDANVQAIVGNAAPIVAAGDDGYEPKSSFIFVYSDPCHIPIAITAYFLHADHLSPLFCIQVKLMLFSRTLGYGFGLCIFFLMKLMFPLKNLLPSRLWPPFSSSS